MPSNENRGVEAGQNICPRQVRPGAIHGGHCSNCGSLFREVLNTINTTIGPPYFLKVLRIPISKWNSRGRRRRGVYE